VRRSTLFAVLFTALVLVAAGRWPATLADSGTRALRRNVSEVLAWRPAPRIAAPRPERPRSRHRHGPVGLTPEVLAALGTAGGVALGLSLAAALAWSLRPRHLRRRQPLDAVRWLARPLRPAR